MTGMIKVLLVVYGLDERRYLVHTMSRCIAKQPAISFYVRFDGRQCARLEVQKAIGE